MEIFGICLSIPAAFVASTVYCALLFYVIRKHERLRRPLFTGSFFILAGFLIEVALLATLGTLGSRALLGPGFYLAHSTFILLGTPALANVLVLPKRGPVLRWWFLAVIPCTVFAFCLVILQYDVAETLEAGENAIWV